MTTTADLANAQHRDAGDDVGEPARSRVGEVLASRYCVTRLLREGGMGAVFEASHTHLKRRFAIKFLSPALARRADILERFRREAEAAGSIENEHIAAVLDYGTAADGAPYIVMEYLQGEDLAELLARTGPLSFTRATRLLVQACRGLEAAHDRGIVHRDLKPRNLFVCRRNQGENELLKVLDFGVAKLSAAESTTDRTQSGVLLGTPFYMPPEQMRGDTSIDCRADVYALGVILYEMLTGERPHPGRTSAEIFYHLLTRTPTPLDQLRPNLPPALCAIVHRAMAVDPAERFARVAELRGALSPFAAPPAPRKATAHASDETLAAEAASESFVAVAPSARSATAVDESRSAIRWRPLAWSRIGAAMVLGGLALLAAGWLAIRRAATTTNEVRTSAALRADAQQPPIASDQAPATATPPSAPALAIDRAAPSPGVRAAEGSEPRTAPSPSGSSSRSHDAGSVRIRSRPPLAAQAPSPPPEDPLQHPIFR
jgi:serine/threonine-protein kinase